MQEGRRRRLLLKITGSGESHTALTRMDMNMPGR